MTYLVVRTGTELKHACRCVCADCCEDCPVNGAGDSIYCFSRFNTACVERLQPAVQNGFNLGYLTQTHACPTGGDTLYNTNMSQFLQSISDSQDALAGTLPMPVAGLLAPCYSRAIKSNCTLQRDSYPCTIEPSSVVGGT